MMAFGSAISAKANIRAPNVKGSTPGRSQNRLHTQKALMEFLMLGRVEG